MLHRVFDVGKERGVRAPLCSPPLREGDALTQRCSVSSGGVCHAPKKLFCSWPGMAASQDRRLSWCWHHETLTALWHAWRMCRHCLQNILQGCPGSCHLPGAANPPPRGSSVSSNWCQCLQARAGWHLLELSPHKGCQARVLTGVQPPCHTDAPGVTSGAAAHPSGPACSAV